MECYADYNNDEDAKEVSQWDHRFDDCPRVGNYKIGSYWIQAEYARQNKPLPPDETWEFIEARMNWAENIIRQSIMTAVNYYKLLKKWDLNGEPPLEPALPFSY